MPAVPGPRPGAGPSCRGPLNTWGSPYAWAAGRGLTYYALAPNEPFSFDGGPMTVPVDDLRALLRPI